MKEVMQTICLHTPSVTVPESFTGMTDASSPSVGKLIAALQSVLIFAVLLPESFRGGCSIGVRRQLISPAKS